MRPSGFSPKARWDRHIPQTQDQPFDPHQLNERIEVMAYFKAGKIYPRLFIWNNKKYKIRQITYNWQERQGEEVINYFSVNTGADLYHISFNNNSNGWRIDNIID